MKKNFLFLTILFIFFTNYSFSQDVKILDGDTIKINGETIRFSGIDTPETLIIENTNNFVI